jgi:arsenite/tail-anchored protein-transporting ATPase
MRILLYTGKGGVGKTSLSAATALAAARKGHRVLVMSTDPAHSLSDSLDMPLGSSPTPVAEGLDALEIDVNEEFRQHWGAIKDYLSVLLRAQGMNDLVAEEMTVVPGIEELFSLLKIQEFADSGRYDVIVLDCAPTGNTMRLLSLPEALRWYMDRYFQLERRLLKAFRPLAEKVVRMPLPEDDVFAHIERLYEGVGKVREMLVDPEMTSIRLVCNPEKMVIRESQRALTYLSLFGFTVDMVVMNKVFPEEAGDGYLKEWLGIQAGHLEEAERGFAPLKVARVPFQKREVVGVQALNELAKIVFGRKDPAESQIRTVPMRMEKDDDGYSLFLHLPFAEKAELDCWVKGDELIVSIRNFRRSICLPRSLAGLPLKKAAFRDGWFRITFGVAA